LYLDIPLGSHPQGFDTWMFRDLCLESCSIGAPPDPLAPQGQNWGLPPLHPYRLRAAGYQYWRLLLASHMRVSSIVRIDHIMGLHRLYIIPQGVKDASQGVYLYYPYPELYGVLAIESHRWRCEVVGEDLGTVPDEVREEMDRRGIRRLYVFPFECRTEPEPPIREVPRGAVACLNTHDLHPFAAWWEGEDIEDMVAGGILNPDQGEELRKRRRELIEVVRAYLTQQYGEASKPLHPSGKTGMGVEGNGGEPLELAIKFLSDSPADIVFINLQDLLGDREPHNRPGTLHPHNWRLRITKSWEDLVAGDELERWLNLVNEFRSKVRMRRALPQGYPERQKEPTRMSMQLPTPWVEIGPCEPRFFLTDDDLYLFNEGRQLRLWEKLGAFPIEVEGREGCRFAVWAPDAEFVSVIGDFNGWNKESHPLYPHGSSGVWEGFIPGLKVSGGELGGQSSGGDSSPGIHQCGDQRREVSRGTP
ncbi:MAG: 4-alpha-glucanotransferase, partial [bacterium]